MSLQSNRQISISDINKNLYITSGNVGISTSTPAHTLDVNGGVRSTHFTTTNALATNVSSGTLNLSTGLTAGTILATTSISSGGVNATNSTVTNFVATSITAGPIYSINNVNAAQGIVLQNTNSGSSAYSSLTFVTDQVNNFNIFKNSTTRTVDGGVNTVTMRNDGGPIRLQSNTGLGIWVGSTGNVGINTTTPASPLHIAGDIKMTPASSGDNVGISLLRSGTADWSIYNPTGSSNLRFFNSADLMTLTSSGNLGIGTITPSSKLEVYDADSSIIRASGAVGGQQGFNITDSASRWSIYKPGNTTDLRFFDGTDDRITFKNGGNVGIGTASPTTKLNVVGGTDIFGTLRVGASSSSQAFLIDLGSSGVGSTRSGYIYGDGTNIDFNNQQNGYISFATNNTGNRFTIYADGRCGIGTSSTPANNGLQINSAELQLGPSDSNAIHMYGSGGALSFYSGSWGAGTYLGTWNKTGLGIGADPIAPLHIYKNANGAVNTYLENANSGSSAYVSYVLKSNSGGVFSIFKNSSTRTDDGGVNTTTIRNDGGALRLMSNTGSGMVVDTSGNVTVYGALSKGSGSFDITHPLHSNDKTKRLVHSFIEGPRCDLIYRGKVQLVNGTATINIDSDCVEETDCEMTQGTFEALCANPRFFLQNPSSFSRLKGSISGNILSVVCEDQNSSDIIYWSVIAERKDNFIKQWDRTNANGYLITEYEKEDLYNP